MNSSRLFAKCMIVAGIAATAHAQGFYWNTASAGSLALGGVYLPSAAGASDSLAANPAGLATLNNRSVDMSVTSVFLRGSFSNSVNNNVPTDTAPGVIPYAVMGLPIARSRFSVALGILPEMMSVSNWNYVDAPGAAGATYGLQKEKSAIVAARAAGGLGFAVNKKLSVGMTAGAVYNTNTLDTTYVFQENPALAGLKTLLDMHTTGWGWNVSGGLIVTPTDRMQFNAAWKSRTVINSTGIANGNIGVQLAAAGLTGVPGGFTYNAAVQNVLPQSVTLGMNRRVDGRWVVAAETDWVDWRPAFHSLPVSLTNGSNTSIDGYLGTSSIFDRVPLDWKDQYAFRGGVERLVTESVSVRGGYAHTNSPLPDSTLMPLTAAIMTNQISTGVTYTHGRQRWELAYGFDPIATQNVGKSALLSGEYNNSQVRIGTQSLALNTSIQF